MVTREVLEGEQFIDLMASLHKCCACEEVCDCTEGDVGCVGCQECVEFYLKQGVGPSLHPTIREELELSDVPRLPSEKEREAWCCRDVYPFHYTDCKWWGGMGIAKVRGDDD